MNFKKDAEKEENSKESRAELYFLSLFHLIEACASIFDIHINKHQILRSILEKNSKIFRDKTKEIWTSFQMIETRLRPKFSYGFSWIDEDFDELKDLYSKIESICLKVIKNESEQ
ncbi:MAG TPA: hypothetical protein VGB37_03385 [Candidatus Lokiarchaeia archaeon]